ncbi:hypothetical protein BP6252_12958 [Coleophoma cylindrospora]|uniref:Uncharacterized protein n=1 Tax=Coleophoma cylindrospora TaxID=1849047 RepID=A0A3D8QDT3_9HELO|nr:hypothetical protein BP6252_12958 [Coleophoma cylindrospora]
MSERHAFVRTPTTPSFLDSQYERKLDASTHTDEFLIGGSEGESANDPWKPSAFESIRSFKKNPVFGGKSTARAPTWSPQPRRLQRTALDWASLVFYNGLTYLVTFPFFALAARVGQVNGKVTNPETLQRLQNLTKMAATVFPIAFALVAGRTMSKVAAWHLEKGARLQTLEQLMGSRTVFGAVRTQFMLSSYNLLALALVFIWAMSPLGGQATLRVLNTSTKQDIANSVVNYLDTTGPSSFQGSNSATVFLATLNGMYFSSLTAPNTVKSSSLDLWGNLKIPYLTSTGSDWVDVAATLDPSEYSSVLGIPLFNVIDGVSKFNLESNYMQLDCTNVTAVVGDADVRVQFANATTHAVGSLNGTFQGACCVDPNAPDCKATTSWCLGVNNFASRDYMWQRPAGLINITGEIPQTTLLYEDAPYNFGNNTVAECQVTQRYVESSVSCNKTSAQSICAVVAQRESQLAHANSNLTWMSFSGVFDEISTLMPAATGAYQHSGMIDYTQKYVLNPNTSVIMTVDQETGNNTVIGELDPQLIGKRLGQLFNAYYIGSIAPFTMNGDPELGQQVLQPNNYTDANPVFTSLTGDNLIHSVAASVTTETEIYKCSWRWLGILVIATFIMFVLAVVGTYYDVRRHTPEILGFCSTLTRDSKYVAQPGPGGSLLEGFERARWMKDVQLRFGDVYADGEAGLMTGEPGLDGEHIRSLGVAEVKMAARVRPGRLYA